MTSRFAFRLAFEFTPMLHRSFRSALAPLLAASTCLPGCGDDDLEPWRVEAPGHVWPVGGGGAEGMADGAAGSPSPSDAGASASSGQGGAGAGGPVHEELDGGAAGSASDLDAAASEPLDGGDACVPTTLYRDGDGDSYGDISESRVGCPGPGWVPQAGDCHDGNALVHPGQTEFFGVPYADPNGPSRVSFDYDCSDTDDADPTNSPSTAAPACLEIADTAECAGSGYVSGTREGPGIEPLCGSRVRRDCVVLTLLGCTASDTNVPVEEAFRCH